MAAPYAPPNSPSYVPPTGEEPTEFGTIVRPTLPLSDDLRAVTIGNLMDGINAAWNGWEQACKFEDEGLQTYYMKYINLLSNTLEKVRKI